MVPRIGTEFAGYRIVALLGRGGMSVVFRAVSTDDGQVVALKVMAPELVDDEDFRERFVAESRLVTALDHPSIVTIYETGEAERLLFIAMRCFPADLRSVLNASGSLPSERTTPIVQQIAGAIDAAAAEGLIHRDVKPANILLEGAEGDAFLADFGVAKRAEGVSGPTERGQVLGTFAYMAPEQIEERPLDGRTDQYALGCVAFECLTGSPPFRRENDAAVLWAHMQELPPAASEVRPGLPDGLDDVLWRALAKSPDERFASCSDFAGALEAAACGEHPVARKPPPPEPEKAAKGSTRRRVVAVLVLVLLGVAGAAAVLAAAALRGDDSPGGVTTTAAAPDPSTETASSDLTAFDLALLPSIPPAFSASCDHVQPISSDFDATLSCDPGAFGGPVLYSHARSGDLLREHLREQVVEAGIELASGDGLTAVGRCPGTVPALQEWRMDGPVGHHEVNSQRLLDEGMTRGELQRTVIGHVLCYEDDDGFQLQWSDRRAGVYAQAAGDGKLLTDWWRSEAGPRHALRT